MEDLPSVAGMKQLEAILDIVKNEVAYKKRLKDLEKKRADLVALIRTVGDVNAIEEIRLQAQVEKSKVLAELAGLHDKKEKADEVIAEARVAAKSMESDALSRIRSQKDEVDQREKQLAEQRRQLDDREKEVRQAEAKVEGARLATNAELSRLAQLQELANKARTDYEDRRQQIEKALAGIG